MVSLDVNNFRICIPHVSGVIKVFRSTSNGSNAFPVVNGCSRMQMTSTLDYTIPS